MAQAMTPPLLTAAQTRAADQATITTTRLTGLDLMEQAGYAAWRIVRRQRAAWARQLVVFAGQGHNGGDGWVIARLAQQAGWTVDVWTLVDRAELRGDART